MCLCSKEPKRSFGADTGFFGAAEGSKGVQAGQPV